MVGGGDQQSLAESVMVGGGPAEPSIQQVIFEHLTSQGPHADAERRWLTWPYGAHLVTRLWGSAEDFYRADCFVASTRLKI